jgi:type II secretory pathway pseudopilin PulG
MIEILLVVAIIGVIVTLVSPRVSEIRAKSGLRASRQLLTTAFAAARAAALQKGKTSTLTLTATSASVSVLSGLTGNPVTILGPLRFDKELNSSVSAVTGASMTVSFDSRGLVTPMPGSISKYRIANGVFADTVCISPAGIILPKGCEL